MSTLENRSASSEFSLVVKGGHPAAEVMLLDSRMQLVDRSIGRLETRQPSGIYQLKTQIGRSVEERTILLDRDLEETLPFPDIASPVPLPGASQTHPSHISAARRESRRFHFGQGTGASLFLFVGRWSPGLRRPTSARDFAHPAHGLSIRFPDGKVAADLRRHAALDPAWDGWAAVTVSVDSGVYYLRYKTEKGPVVEQPLIACKGWQTQVFLLRELSGEPREDEIRDSELLANMAILMSRNGFDPGNGDILLTELARLALADDRPFLSQTLLSGLPARMEDPMLGLYCAHLMLRAQARPAEREKLRKRSSPSMKESSFDEGDYARVVGQVRELLGPDHPDVMALSLKFGNVTDRPSTPIRVPPMLRHSWSLIVTESNERADIVGRNVWSRISSLTESRPFLSWIVPPRRRESREDRLVGAIKNRLDLTDQERAPAASEPMAMQAFGTGPARSVMPSDDVAASRAPEEVRRQISVEMGIPRFAIDEAIQKGSKT